MRWGRRLCFTFSTAGFLVTAGTAAAQYDPYNPGLSPSPPGTGCETGTSGCWPSAPPGPVDTPADYGSTIERPPAVIIPGRVPYYGEIPSAPGPLPQAIPTTPEAQRQLEEQAAAPAREAAAAAQAEQLADQQRRDDERAQREEQLLQQQQQILNQQERILQQHPEIERPELTPTPGSTATPTPGQSTQPGP